MTSGRDEPRKRRGRGKADAIPDEELGWLAELRRPDPAPEQRLPRRTPGEQQPPRPDDQATDPGRTLAKDPAANPAANPTRAEPPTSDAASTGELPKARDRSTKDAPTPIPQSTRTRWPAPAPAPGPPPRAASAAVPADLRPPAPSRPAPPPSAPPPSPQSPAPPKPSASPPSPPDGPRRPLATGRPPADVPPPRAETPTAPPVTGRPGTTGPGGIPAALTRPTRPPTAPRQTAATAGTPAKAGKRARSPERVENTWGGHDTAGGTGEFFALPPDGSGEFSRPGRGAEALERQRSQVSMLRVATLILVALAVVGAPAAFFVIREFSRDPVFVELDNLSLPAWAAGKHTDSATGSRWCVDECRRRERTWQSARNTDETERAYVAALTKDGWTTWNIPDCQAAGVAGVETCWQRDEFVLNLWVRPTVCDIKPVRPTIGPVPTPPATPAPSAAPSPPACQGSIATVKVVNRISYQQAATS